MTRFKTFYILLLGLAILSEVHPQKTLEEEGHHLAGGGDPPGEVQNPTIMEKADAFLKQTGLMPN